MKSQMERLREQEYARRIKRRQKALEYKKQLDDQIKLKKCIHSTNSISDNTKSSYSFKSSNFQNQDTSTKYCSSIGTPIDSSGPRKICYNDVTINHPTEQGKAKNHHTATTYKLFLEKQIRENAERRKAERESEKLMANITVDMATIMLKGNKVEQKKNLGKGSTQSVIRTNENNFKINKFIESDELNATSNKTRVDETTSTCLKDNIPQNHMLPIPPNMKRNNDYTLVKSYTNDNNYHDLLNGGSTFPRRNEERIRNGPSTSFQVNEYEHNYETCRYKPVSSVKTPLNSGYEIMYDHNLPINRTHHLHEFDTERREGKIHDNCEDLFPKSQCKWRTNTLKQNKSNFIHSPNPYFNEQALTVFSQQLKMYIERLRKNCNDTRRRGKKEYGINSKKNNNCDSQMTWYEKSEETAIRKKNEIARQRKNAYDEQIRAVKEKLKFKNQIMDKESMEYNAEKTSGISTYNDILSHDSQKDKNYELNSNSDIIPLNAQRNDNSCDVHSNIDMNQRLTSDDRVNVQLTARGKPSSRKKFESNHVHHMCCSNFSSDFHTINSFHNQGRISEIIDDDDAIQSQSQLEYI